MIQLDQTLSFMDNLALLVRDRSTANRGDWIIDEYEVQGVVTRVYSDRSLYSEAIRELLGPFNRPLSDAGSSLEFYLLTGEDHYDVSVPSSAKLLYDMGCFKYFWDGDLRYMEVPARAFSTANVVDGKAIIHIFGELKNESWSVAHTVFSPLWMQLIKNKGLFPIHAAAMVKNGIGIVIPAFSGEGKSVLSINLAKEGYKLLGDDTVFLQRISKGVQVVGFSERINLRPDALDLFEDLNISGELYRGGSRFSVDIGSVFPGCFVDSSAPHVLLIPELTDVDGVSYREISKAEALGRLFRYCLFFLDPASSRENMEILSILAESTSCFKLSIGKDRKGLLEALEDIVRNLDSSRGHRAGSSSMI